MLIVILGWLYVIAMVAITAPTVALGIVIFLGGGLAPAVLWLYIAGSRIRRARRLRPDDVVAQAALSPDSDARQPSPPKPPTASH
ncbi:hypothetical protein [Pandoraea terrigena]|uniref:Transmembrane protein n=1 Tax=Pandoraea terrigena TaxID=2508292 RepID=A0A5E4V917_9BURK|nr:hypothetical protein [Pandoraea terrigena]VVE08762.1 hypothetical protein PTE31013_02534 [Pandoraea terrigena]